MDEAAVNSIAINEVQLVLAEKRTTLSVMRTGIAVFALPLSVFSVLIATSRYYDFFGVLKLIVPLFILCALLIALGLYLVVKAIVRMRRYDRLIVEIKKQHSSIAEFID